ncbi:hypothetical protein V8F06_003402 [Rhypophila decipiens]
MAHPQVPSELEFASDEEDNLRRFPTDVALRETDDYLLTPPIFSNTAKFKPEDFKRAASSFFEANPSLKLATPTPRRKRHERKRKATISHENEDKDSQAHKSRHTLFDDLDTSEADSEQGLGQNVVDKKEPLENEEQGDMSFQTRALKEETEESYVDHVIEATQLANAVVTHIFEDGNEWDVSFPISTQQENMHDCGIQLSPRLSGSCSEESGDVTAPLDSYLMRLCLCNWARESWDISEDGLGRPLYEVGDLISNNANWSPARDPADWPALPEPVFPATVELAGVGKYFHAWTKSLSKAYKTVFRMAKARCSLLEKMTDTLEEIMGWMVEVQRGLPDASDKRNARRDQAVSKEEKASTPAEVRLTRGIRRVWDAREMVLREAPTNIEVVSREIESGLSILKRTAGFT